MLNDSSNGSLYFLTKRQRRSRFIWFLAVMAVALLSAGWVFLSYIVRPIWSIGIYAGDNPFTFSPLDQIDSFVLTASDVTDVPARFVADPFMLKKGNTWYMFFEVLNTWSGQGDIGLATSDDGKAWQYKKIVLDEPFHLSFPCIFQANGSYYMIPESRRVGSVRLYKANKFPYQWIFVKDILTGNYADPSIVFHNGIWWLFVLRDSDKLTLHYSEAITGPWTEHPQSPLINGDMNICRPAGRLMLFRDKLTRYAQDCDPSYGNSVRAFIIDELTATSYKEHESPQGPILAGDGAGWNAEGMHQIDPHRLGEGKWIACVDGHQTMRIFEWRRPIGGLHKLVETVAYTPIIKRLLRHENLNRHDS